QRFAPIWLVAMLLAQTTAIACLWALQHIAIAVGSWPAVISSQLAGNALAKVAPGGGAVGSALQYKMLIASRVPSRPAVSGLTAANLLTFAVMLALPVLAIPSLIRGSVQRTLIEAAVAGPVVFLVPAALAPWLPARRRPVVLIR